jgi:uncharacterized Fe-S cluster-containing radical SAM superfamily protein
LGYIGTDRFSATMRSRAIQLAEQKILIARLTGSDQEQDLTEPANCQGFGRIRHFRLVRYSDWSENPLPILPAAKALGYDPDTAVRAQVFQNAVCNWRCWYCYVDFNRLSGDHRYAKFFAVGELLDLYLAEPNRPLVIDLSGGQPDLVPEWLVWTMRALIQRGLAGQIFLWSDNNLSNRYFWRYLSEVDHDLIARFPKYARVACFKGYDEASFAFNTGAEPELFIEQFNIYRDLLTLGLDMYAYVTLTALPHTGLDSALRRFVDLLQSIHVNLPLRTVPLKIDVFTPTRHRVRERHQDALRFQYDLHQVWREELRRRFRSDELAQPLCDVPMRLG